jgi:hypothetical protein
MTVGMGEAPQRWAACGQALNAFATDVGSRPKAPSPQAPPRAHAPSPRTSPRPGAPRRTKTPRVWTWGCRRDRPEALPARWPPAPHPRVARATPRRRGTRPGCSLEDHRDAPHQAVVAVGAAGGDVVLELLRYPLEQLREDLSAVENLVVGLSKRVVPSGKSSGKPGGGGPLRPMSCSRSVMVARSHSNRR